ncbi:MAG: hypothetical protein AB1642_07955 [Pseudomonadota bacterium]
MSSRLKSVRALLIALLLGLLALPARPMQVELALATLDHPAFSATGLRVRFDALRPGGAEIRLDRLRVAGIEYRALRLACAGFRFDGRRLACPAGKLYRDDARGRDRAPLPFAFEWRDDGYLDFRLEDADAVALSPLVKRLRAWNPKGRIDLHLRVAAGQDGAARLDLTAHALDFANRAGDVAGAGIAFTLAADARRTEAGWRWTARLDWPAGELRFDPWRRAGGVRIDAAGTLTPALLEVEQARLGVDGVGAVTASLRWDRAAGAAREWGLVSERIDLAAALREWLQPWLAGLGFPEWRAAGQILFAAEWRDGGLRRFYAGLEDATLADSTGYLELRGLRAQVPWEADAPSEAAIEAAAGRFGDLPLEGFRIPLRLEGATARIENLSAPMLDGRFEVEQLRLARADGGWQAEFAGAIEGVSMPKLSRALKLPAMDGSMSAHVPRIAYADGVLRMDGALGIAVFDGGLIVHQLRMVDPFSARRRLIAAVTARGLDLGMLTRTFAFGSIEGRFDADLHELEMDGWTPLRFDARIADTPGDHPRLLSLGALRDIAELGEAAENRALRRIPERSLGGFGYARIGLGCKLRAGVCELSGIPGRDAPDRVVIMEGSGIPSIDILGYNRRIDWNALVARFREVLAGRPGYVIE